MILNNAADIKIGSTDVDRVYLGNAIVWERNNISDHVILPTSSWEQGGVGSWGNEYDSAARLRAIGYFPIGDYSTIRFVAHDPVNSNLQWGIQGFHYHESDDVYTSSYSYEGDWVNNGDSYNINNLVATDTTHFRLYLRYSTNNGITVDDFDYAEFFLS